MNAADTPFFWGMRQPPGLVKHPPSDEEIQVISAEIKVNFTSASLDSHPFSGETRWTCFTSWPYALTLLKQKWSDDPRLSYIQSACKSVGPLCRINSSASQQWLSTTGSFWQCQVSTNAAKLSRSGGNPVRRSLSLPLWTWGILSINPVVMMKFIGRASSDGPGNGKS